MAITMIAVVTMFAAPLTGVAFASETGSDPGAVGTVTECKCPPGNHYGHCKGKGKHKGHHKKAHECEEHAAH
ncbi:MAG: hypothetical protein C4534_10095 [Gaiellales bacterium]|nr:MAG: hypothetical protein C4534_10095 [Gaiellales bacterium]